MANINYPIANKQELDNLKQEVTSHKEDYAKYKQTASGTLVASYTHTTNKEVFISAVDVNIDTFTSVGHGLKNGDIIYIVPRIDLIYNISKYPTPITNFTQYYVINKTDNTFQLSLTNGGLAIDLTSNPNLDLNSFCFEILAAGWSIIDLPDIYKCRVVITGRSVAPPNTFSVVVNNKPWESVYHELATPTSLRNHGFLLNGGDIYTKVVADIDFLNCLDCKYDVYAIRNKTTSAFEINTYANRFTTKKYYNEKISTISSSYKIANGTKVEVYAI